MSASVCVCLCQCMFVCLGMSLCVSMCVCVGVYLCVYLGVWVCACACGGAVGSQERIGDTLALPPGLCPNIDGGNLPTLNSVSVLDDIA